MNSAVRTNIHWTMARETEQERQESEAFFKEMKQAINKTCRKAYRIPKQGSRRIHPDRAADALAILLGRWHPSAAVGLLERWAANPQEIAAGFNRYNAYKLTKLHDLSEPAMQYEMMDLPPIASQEKLDKLMVPWKASTQLAKAIRGDEDATPINSAVFHALYGQRLRKHELVAMFSDERKMWQASTVIKLMARQYDTTPAMLCIRLATVSKRVHAKLRAAA